MIIIMIMIDPNVTSFHLNLIGATFLFVDRRFQYRLGARFYDRENIDNSQRYAFPSHRELLVRHSISGPRCCPCLCSDFRLFFLSI